MSFYCAEHTAYNLLGQCMQDRMYNICVANVFIRKIFMRHKSLTINNENIFLWYSAGLYPHINLRRLIYEFIVYNTLHESFLITLYISKFFLRITKLIVLPKLHFPLYNSNLPYKTLYYAESDRSMHPLGIKYEPFV